jgi:hypothetical protein
MSGPHRSDDVDACTELRKPERKRRTIWQILNTPKEETAHNINICLYIIYIIHMYMYWYRTTCIRFTVALKLPSRAATNNAVSPWYIRKKVKKRMCTTKKTTHHSPGLLLLSTNCYFLVSALPYFYDYSKYLAYTYCGYWQHDCSMCYCQPYQCGALFARHPSPERVSLRLDSKLQP